MRKVFAIAILLNVSACVTIEAPEHLVADTVEAGKSAYHSVKESMSEDDSAEGRTFSHRYMLPDNELTSTSHFQCINSALETAKKTMNIYNVQITKTATSLIVEDGKSFLECNVVVAN